MSDKNIPKASNDAELKSAIIAFEQILDAEPNDRLALETLSDAYARMGDTPKAVAYLARLAEVIANENDIKTAPEIIRRLRTFSTSKETQQAEKRLQEMLKKTSIGEEETAVPVRRTHDITREVSLAWDLLQAEEISQEDYAMVVQDLSENSTKHIEVPVTVLHALQDRNFKHLDRVIAFLARTSGKPLVSLAHFEIQPDLVSMLPQEFMTYRGAIIFEKIGLDLLVAVLNPFDIDLQEDVRKVTDRRCHFFLASAGDFDNMLLNVRKLRAMLST